MVTIDTTQEATNMAGSDTPSHNNPSIPFWNMNIPPHLHTPTCPSYLEYAFQNHKDREILSTPDHLYRRQTWPEVQKFVRDNRLDLFQRVPSELRRYREYSETLVEEYGTVMKFVVEQRLRWGVMEAKGDGFGEAADYKILYNDWPYGLDERIVHLVVWTKFELAEDPMTGDLTLEARQQIQEFVDRTFVEKCGKENVIWFRNWSSLKSIHAVEHFHVMLFDPEREFVKRVTGGDVALAEKFGRKGEV